MKTIIKFILLCTISTTAFAQTDVYIRGAGKLIPIALPQLCNESGDPFPGKEIPRIMARDLDLSGFFEVLSPDAYIESPGKCGGPESVNYSDWSVLGVAGLARGTISSTGGKIRTQLYLHEVGKHEVVIGKEYEGGAADVNTIAHKFANEIMKYYTGEYGPFGTQIAFSTRVARFKELAIMDWDGSNIRQLTNERALAVSPAWAPSGDTLVYTSYRNRTPDIFTFDLSSKSTKQVTRNTKLEVGTRFGPGGGSLITSSTDGGTSEILKLDLNGSVLAKLTSSSGGIDVSPRYSPDYAQVAFCSNRAGGPQIYVMGADGSAVHRISFVSSNYCTSPAWSPKGDKIAFVCRSDGGFNIFTVNIDGSNPFQLTSGGDNEDPDWSPDGRYLTFASTQKGNFGLALMKADGSNFRQLTTSRGGDYQPVWGPMPK